MSEKLSDMLDLVLERLRTGEPISTILTDYPAEAEQLGPLLETAASLDDIPPVKMPAPAEFQADRAEFLAQVTNLQQQAVSPGLFGRLKEGIVHALPWFALGVAHSEGRQRRMGTLAIKAMLVFGLLFGSAGATAAMAANSLPDSPLYPVKLAMEDARLAVTTSPAQQAQLHLAMVGERTREMTQQALNGDVPGAPTLDRLQHHLNYTLQLASQLPDEELTGVLTQAQAKIRTLAQEMSQLQPEVVEPAQVRLRQAYQLLKQAEGEAEGGLVDPLAFRRSFGRNRPDDEPASPEAPLPLEGAEPVPVQNPDVNPDCPAGDCPQNQYQPGQESDTLPGHYGGQPCDTEGCMPAGDQNQHQDGPDEPDPGKHGNQGEEECTPPFGEEHKYGQGTGETNGPPDGCGGECDGNQNQYEELNQEKNQQNQQNQELNQEQNQEPEQPGPNGNDDDGQNGPLIGPGGSSAGGGGSSNDSRGSDSSSDNGGTDSSGNSAKSGDGGKKN